MTAIRHSCQRPSAFTIPVMDALKEFQGHIDLANDVVRVEQLRRNFLPGIEDADERLLANDYCDEKIFSLTGHRLPAAKPDATIHDSRFNGIKPACPDLSEDRPSEFLLSFAVLRDRFEEALTMAQQFGAHDETRASFGELAKAAEGFAKLARDEYLGTLQTEAGVVR